MGSYYKKVAAQTDGVLAALSRSGVAVDDIVFGGRTAPPRVIRVPSFADSKFQAEQALGDWAEQSVAAGLNRSLQNHKAIHYGFSSKTVAGEEGFSDEYKRGVIDTCEWGKRADLLIVPKSLNVPADISDLATEATSDIVAASIGAVEVRSSRTEALKYIAYQERRVAEGVRVDNKVPNFTVKIEDLVKVFRWIEVFGKPQIYAQVFFDVVYGINVLDIMRFIAGANKLKIDEPQRSRKVTIFIPITQGARLGTVAKYPNFEVVDRVTANGRHDIFARPSGGRMDLNGEAVVSALSSN